MQVAPRRLIVGISGASGSVYGLRVLQLLRETEIETHLVVSRAGDITRAHELAESARELRALATAHYSIADVGAAIASGSFRTMGMIVAPCSVSTLAEIATGVTGNLLSRAADVTLKERRRLVLMVRETPLHLGHIRNMLAVTEAGAIVMPPVPAFYARPASLEDMVTATVARALDLFGIETGAVPRWGEELPTRPARE
ncbi:MAG: UbiX family flavin prenyltransferase [Geminicoccaceae bacterium]